ncbi:MAG: sulfatase [Candidatus Nanohaloarchaea archaeon]
MIGASFNDARYWLNNRRSGKPFFSFIHGYDVHGPFGSSASIKERKRFIGSYSGVLKNDKFILNAKKDPQNYGKDRVYVFERLDRSNGNWVLHTANGTIKLDQKDVEYIRAMYDAGVYHADKEIGQFLDYLKKNGLYEDSIIVITSSHGEMVAQRQLLDKTYIGHTTPYIGNIKVPFIIKFPGVGHRVIDKQVQTFDLLPTLMDYSGIVQNATMQKRIQGKSLMPLINGKKGKKYYDPYAYSMLPVAVVTQKWSFVPLENFPAFGSQLFDLQKDPEQKNNLIDKRPLKASELRRKMREWELKNWRLRNEIYG